VAIIISDTNDERTYQETVERGAFDVIGGPYLKKRCAVDGYLPHAARAFTAYLRAYLTLRGA